MKALYQSALTDLSGKWICTAQAEKVTWKGREALRLENGLLLLPSLPRTDAHIEVLIGTDGPAYPGIAFRAADLFNYELAYAVPHASDQWDAIQYDPVFHNSNTWQNYYGPSYQQAAAVPTGQWFRLQVTFCGGRAAIAVDDQPPLIVAGLAHPVRSGLLGLWTYLPAYLADFQVFTCDGLDIPAGNAPIAPAGSVDAWRAEGYGVVRCEPNGVLNLNRYLPRELGQVRLTRNLAVDAAGEVTFEPGFSDRLRLELDGEVIFEGEWMFKGFADRAARGYAELGTYRVGQNLAAGTHHLAAQVEVSEGFGWGLALAAHGPGLRWLPPEWAV